MARLAPRVGDGRERLPRHRLISARARIWAFGEFHVAPRRLVAQVEIPLDPRGPLPTLALLFCFEKHLPGAAVVFDAGRVSGLDLFLDQRDERVQRSREWRRVLVGVGETGAHHFCSALSIPSGLRAVTVRGLRPRRAFRCLRSISIAARRSMAAWRASSRARSAAWSA